jgi:hypothetical protein
MGVQEAIMARRTEVGTMVRGMGMGMRLLELFIKKIRERGGNEEVLAFLTRPRFEENLEKIAKAITDCDWRIPASEMCFLAEKGYRDNFDVNPEFIEEARNLWWFYPLNELGIQHEKYNSDPRSGEPAIPPHLLSELDGKRMEYPLRLMGGKYVVVNWATGDKVYKPGDAIDSKEVEIIGLAEARYFDFEK